MQDGDVQTKLKAVVAKITPAGASVAYVRDDNSPMSQVNNIDDEKSCFFNYYGLAQAIKKFKSKL